MTEVKDEDLFVIDRGNKKKEPKKGNDHYKNKNQRQSSYDKNAATAGK